MHIRLTSSLLLFSIPKIKKKKILLQNSNFIIASFFPEVEELQFGDLYKGSLPRTYIPFSKCLG